MCGNFGIIFLDPRFRDKVLPLLREMIRITMMRGAQSAGIATYLRTASAANTRERLGFLSRLGVRSRVVNGKRTDLSALVMRRLAWDLRRAAAFHGVGDAIEAPQVFQGHTRFATTSISNLDGCHPHQWTPPSTRMAWGYDSGSGALEHDLLSVGAALRAVCEALPGSSPSVVRAAALEFLAVAAAAVWQLEGGREDAKLVFLDGLAAEGFLDRGSLEAFFPFASILQAYDAISPA